jgi:hypothetical protein
MLHVVGWLVGWLVGFVSFCLGWFGLVKFRMVCFGSGWLVS